MANFIKHIITTKFVLISIFICFTLITIFSCNIPFFWDYVKVSQAACFITDHNFSTLIIPENLDPGHAPIVAFYFALMWTIFGKSLIVSHLVMLPFVIGLIWEFYKLAKQFLSEYFVKISLLFLLLEPVFCTQTILMGYDIISAYLFIASLNCLHKSQKICLLIFQCFLVLISLRGIPLVIAVFLIHFFVYRKESVIDFFKKSLLLYLFPAIIILAWFIYHYYNRGWIFTAPSWESHRKINSVSMMFRQSFFIAWKLADYFKIVFWIFVIIFSVKLFKTDVANRKILLLLIIPVVCLSLFMIPFSNPIGHKYFLPVFLMLIIAVSYHIQFIKSKIRSVFVIVFFCIISFLGNFIMYPERFGNGWDTSLKVLSYFNLKEQTDKYILDNNIEPNEVGASFPMFGDCRYSNLSKVQFALGDFENKSVEKWNYILLSNISNLYTDQLKNELRTQWKLQQKFNSGFVYLELYQNPILK